jgi:hypothetical protein
MGLYRAQILLEADQHLKLERRAQESGRSISDLVREIVDEYLTRKSESEALRRSLTALDGLTHLRGRLEHDCRPLDASFLGAFLDDLREERDAESAP